MPLKPGSSKKTISSNISEFHGGKTYNATETKFGKKKADAQAIAVAMNNARKYAEGGKIAPGDNPWVEAEKLVGPKGFGSRGGSSVKMSPQEYLSLASPFGKNGSRPMNENTVSHFVDNGWTKNPMLSAKEGESGKLQVGLHDGRHRAVAAARRGEHLIDVDIVRGQKLKRENPNLTDAEVATRVAREGILPEYSKGGEINGAMGRTRGYAAGGASPSYWEKSAARNLSRGSMLHSDVPGRTDKLPIKVQSGSYVVPADIVSGLGQGNSLAGTKAISSMVDSGGLRAPKLKMKAFRRPKIGTRFASGGPTPRVPIIAAGGEHILTPDEVRQIGHGDMEHGHNYLDSWVIDERKKNRRTLGKLKPPKTD